MRLIDISVPLRESMPTWPGGEGFELRRQHDIGRGDSTTVSVISMDVHAGTHIDAPAHFVAGGGSVDTIRLEDCLGPVFVADLRGVRQIDASSLQRAVPEGVKRLLLRTDNSQKWGVPEFDPEFSALTVDGAEWLAGSGVRLVGNDYLSIQLYGGDPRTHTVLMDSGVVIVEGLDLSSAPLGWHELILLPLRVAGAEAAPVRAVLRVEGADNE